jgi:signal transduction histidine kinase
VPTPSNRDILQTVAAEDETRSTDQSKKLRRVLLAAFGGLLTLSVLAGLDSLLSLRQLDQVGQQINQRFSAHNQALSTVIISAHVYDEQMERYLLQDPRAVASPTTAEIVSRGTEVRAALGKYPIDCEPEEALLLKDMETQVLEQANSFATVSNWGEENRQKRARQFIDEQLVPRRVNILQISQQISFLNGRRLADENRVLATRFQDLKMRLTWMIALALVAGVLLSLVSGVYILRLEQQGRQRYQALARSRLELEGLSARLVEVQEAERLSISRELHDEVGQTLGALLVEVGQLSNLVPPEDRVTQGQIARIKSVAENAVKSIRDIALLLRPPMLDDLGLVPALEWQAREVSRRGELEVEVHSENVSEKLPDEIKVCLYRLVQEALNNAATHASANNAKVTVVQVEDKITIEIMDDGKGFDPERTRGMGILGMDERVKRLGGTFVVHSARGKGTTVKAELPISFAD